ncbi:MAG: CHRD domain-containing protein [Longimicrobiales bacterium]
MRIQTVFGTVLALALAATPGCDDPFEPEAGPRIFVATLSGDVFTPPVEGVSGIAELVYVDTALVYMVDVAGLDSISAAHVHLSDPDRSDPLLAHLCCGGSIPVGAAPVAEGSLFAGVTGVSVDSIMNVLRAGIGFVDVHTRARPAGALRGALLPAGIVPAGT